MCLYRFGWASLLESGFDMLKTKKQAYFKRLTQSGTSLLEVLLTCVVIAFGLLGLAKLQSKVQVAQVESYQRVQATLLLADISERISNADRALVASYVSTAPIGTDDSQPVSCAGTSMGVDRDLCEWSNALKGAAETKASASVGAMTGARGCITQIQASDATTGICKPGIYQVSVAWQGRHKTIAPNDTCGVDSYGEETYRRVISTQVTIGLPTCKPS